MALSLSSGLVRDLHAKKKYPVRYFRAIPTKIRAEEGNRLFRHGFNPTHNTSAVIGSGA